MDECQNHHLKQNKLDQKNNVCYNPLYFSSIVTSWPIPQMEPLIISPLLSMKWKVRGSSQLEWCMPKSKRKFYHCPRHNYRDPWSLQWGSRPPAQTVWTALPPRSPPGAHRLPRVQGAHREEGPYPLSSLLPLCTFLHGLEDTSNEALNALLCWVVKMVLGRLGRLWSLLSSEAPFPAPWADLQRLSSSSLFPERSRSNVLSPSRLLSGVVCYSIIRHSGPRSEDDLRYEWNNLCGIDPKAPKKGLRKNFWNLEIGTRKSTITAQDFLPGRSPSSTFTSCVALSKWLNSLWINFLLCKIGIEENTSLRLFAD